MREANVFLVEDDKELAELLKKALKSFGYQVVLKAENVEEALENLELFEPLNIRLAIIDGRFLDKPQGKIVDGAGQQVAEAIKEMCPNVKIIAHAGQPENYGDVFLQKPADLQAIRQAIEHLL